MNKDIFCTSTLLYGCLSAALMLKNDAQAKENVLPKDSPVTSRVTDISVAVTPIKAKREIEKLPTAANENLKDVVIELKVIEPKEVMPVVNFLSESIVAAK